MTVLQNGELVLYGFVGDSYFEQGFTSIEVISALAELGRETDVTVRMNSGGGYVHEGLAIYNALAAHKGKVTVLIESVVASSASLLAMAGDHIVMKAGSLLMIHDPSGFTFGTAEDHEKTRVALDKMGDTAAAIYAERSGKDVDEVRASMKEEIWLTADEAVAEGYADEAEKAKAKPASAFDYRIYAHAPQRLVSMARAKNWSLDEQTMTAAPAAHTARTPEVTMSEKDADKIRMDAVKADRERRAGIMALPEAKGRETLAEHLYMTDATIEQAKATLAASPAAAAEVPKAEERADPQAYADARAKATQGLAKPEGGKETGAPDRSPLAAAVARTNKRIR